MDAGTMEKKTKALICLPALRCSAGEGEIKMV